MDDPSADPARVEADGEAPDDADPLAATGALRSPEAESFGTERARERVCLWCMAALPDGDPDRCSSCGARLEEVEPGIEIPGVTALAPEVARIVQVVAAKQAVRSDMRPPVLRLGEQEEHAALEPPSPDVLREMRRLELEAAAQAANASGAGEVSGPDGAPAPDEEPS